MTLNHDCLSSSFESTVTQICTEHELPGLRATVKAYICTCNRNMHGVMCESVFWSSSVQIWVCLITDETQAHSGLLKSTTQRLGSLSLGICVPLVGVTAASFIHC